MSDTNTSPKCGIGKKSGHEPDNKSCVKSGKPGDKSCAKSGSSGSSLNERFRWSFEDPMHSYLKEQEKKDKIDRVIELQSILNASTSSDSSSDSSNDSAPARRKKRKRKKSEQRTDDEPSLDPYDNSSRDADAKHGHRKRKKLKKKKSAIGDSRYSDRCCEDEGNGHRKRKKYNGKDHEEKRRKRHSQSLGDSNSECSSRHTDKEKSRKHKKKKHKKHKKNME